MRKQQVSEFGFALLLVLSWLQPARAEILRVPQDHSSIQSAIDAAVSGDTVLVSAGRYRERLRLAAGITVKSQGDQAQGQIGLKRAENTILDGRFPTASGAGVAMAENSTLDGFTVTGVGTYDDAAWQKHYATQGEEQHEEPIGAAGVAGISVVGVERCEVNHNIVHHIGYTGIAIIGAQGKRVSPRIYRNTCYRNMGGGIGSMKGSTAIIESNVCYENFYAGIGHDNASPLVVNNVCHNNVRAGIGVSEHAKPIVRNNQCYHNRRAGIGIRTGRETQPIIEHNECYENDMAGIGIREHAQPVIRHNKCYKNKMAGIGLRDDAGGVIEHNECYANDMSGIGSRLGSEPVIRHNRCYKNKMAGIAAREEARPVIENNECFENGMAGIGMQLNAAGVIRGNRCYRNQLNGIGARLGAHPVIVENECYENRMAGIGSREGAAPVIRGNRLHHNRMAGIGSRSGARAVILENESQHNDTAGIGVRGSDTVAVIVGNQCLENRLVAVGVPDGATAIIHGNQLRRTGGGAPPLVAIKGGSNATVSDNTIQGGGVAGVLAQGHVRILGNRFLGQGPGQGSAVWVWKDSQVVMSDNRVDGYRNALNASGSKVTATGNITSRFAGAAVIVKSPSSPPHVVGNTAISDDPKNSAAAVEGTDAAAGNVLQRTAEFSDDAEVTPRTWPANPSQLEGYTFHPLANSNRQFTIEDGPWKLVATYGDSTRFALFNTESDPESVHDRAEELNQVVFRLRGLLEQREALEFQREMQPAQTDRSP